MDTLFSQINPQLTTQPDPDQTFRQYIDELLLAEKSKGFGGPFAQPPVQQQSPTPTTSITQGLFGKFLGDTGDTGGSGDGGPSTSPSQTIGTGAMTDAINAQRNASLIDLAVMAAVPGASMLGTFGVPGMPNPNTTWSNLFSSLSAPGDVLNAVNKAADPIAVLNAVQQWTAVDPVYNPWSGTSTYEGNPYGVDPSVDPAGYTDAAMGGSGNVGRTTDASAGWGFGGDFGGGYGDTAGSGAPGSDSDSNGGGGYGGGTGGVGD